MTISVPNDFSFQSSNVTDTAITMEDFMEICESPIITKGLEIQNGEWVYEYNGNVNFTPPNYSINDANAGEYEMDDIVFKDCKLLKVTGKSGSGVVSHKRPKEPDEYGAWDTSMDPSKWTHRWVRTKNNDAQGFLERLWTVGQRQYTVVWNAKYSRNEWRMRDLTASGVCAFRNRAMKTSSKYNAATDIKAQIVKWSANGCQPIDTVQIESMIERNGYFFLRTNRVVPLQYHAWETGGYNYIWEEVRSPADIDGFIKKRRHNAHNPFDGKNYTRTLFNTKYTDGSAEWTMIANEDMDTIALGSLMCDSFDILITEQDGKKLFELTDYEVDNTLDYNSKLEFPTNVVIYSQDMIPEGSVVHVILHGTTVELGTLLPGQRLDAGFTSLAFKNKFKDFSPKEQDQWGNYYYKNGVRVKVHSGTVDLPLMRYDQLDRMMLMIGGQVMIINSSDSIDNHLPDGKRIFSATMMIARFLTFELATKIDQKHIGEIATWGFTLEEIV